MPPWTANHGLVFVEGSVENHRHTACLAKSIDETPIERVCLAIHRLETPRTIHMGYCGYKRSFFFSNLIDLHHEGNVAIFFKPVGNMLLQNRWRKRTKAFAALYF